jgi:hypothetical protein
MKHIFVFLALALCPCLLTAQDKPPVHDGYWWSSLSTANKTGFVFGYVEASTNARDAAFYSCLAEGNGGVIPEKVPADAEFDRCARKAEAEARFPTFSGMRFGQVLQSVENFYSDYRNKNLLITLAFRFANDELSNKPPAEIEAELVSWRRVARENQ